MDRKLNFGCGAKRYKGFYNVDIIPAKGIHQSLDFNIFPYPIKDNQFDYVLIDQVLEHCLFPKRVLRELRRICRNNAIIEIKVPYVNSKSAYAELEHCSFFNRLSFLSLDETDKNWDKNASGKKKFKIIQNKSNPQRFIKWMPTPILDFLSTFLNSIYVDLHVIVQVVGKVQPEKEKINE